MAVEPPVEKHISRLDIYPTPEAGFDKGSGEDHARVAMCMQMACRCRATRKCFNSEAFLSVFELRAHRQILANPGAWRTVSADPSA
jgi:hypothetical protein